MEYSIVRVNKENYALFDDMVYFRINNREKTTTEQIEPNNYTANCVMLNNENLHVYAAQVDNRFVGWISAVFIPKIGHPRYGGKGSRQTHEKEY